MFVPCTRASYPAHFDMGHAGCAGFTRLSGRVAASRLGVNVRYNGGGRGGRSGEARGLRGVRARWSGMTFHPTRSVAAGRWCADQRTGGERRRHRLPQLPKLLKLGPLVGQAHVGGGVPSRRPLVRRLRPRRVPDTASWFEDVGWDLRN